MKKLRFFSSLVKVTTFVAAVLALSLAFTACGDDDSGGGDPFVAVTGITGVSLTGVKGVEFSLSGATVAPANATNKDIEWTVKTAGAGVTGITGTSYFTPTAAGTVTVTATITNGQTASSDYTQDFVINIIDPDNFVAVTKITGVPLKGSIGTAVNLGAAAAVAPAEATFKTIVWSVKTAGAGITAISGTSFTPTAAGTVTITATIASGVAISPATNYTQDFSIVVTDPSKGPAWTAVADSTFGRNGITAIAYGEGTWIAVSFNGGVATSQDGTTWMLVTDPTFFSLRGIAYDGDNRWIIFNDNYIWTSTDKGTTWTRSNVFDSGTSYTIGGIAYGDDTWVVVGGGLMGGAIATSTDGTTWTLVTDTAFGTSYILDIAYGNSTWVAGGEDGKMATSTNKGATWTAVTDTPFDYIDNIAYGDGTWVTVDYHGKIATSTDKGATWVVTDTIFEDDIQEIKDIAYGDGTWYVLGTVGYRGKMATSTDKGTTWAEVTNTAFDSTNESRINGIAYDGNGTWITVGEEYGFGHIAYLKE